MRRPLLYLFLCASLAGCSEPGSNGIEKAATPPSASAPAASLPPPTTMGALDARTAQMWSRSCALCHVDGTAGAPRLGHGEEWQPRLAQGEAVLLQHTVEGFNDMPPLGYCMACENEHFLAMIHFMSGGSLSNGADLVGETP